MKGRKAEQSRDIKELFKEINRTKEKFLWTKYASFVYK